ncbi:MAG: EF-P lysine aminoacylase GenX [Gammaproteobacteria bacterium]|nr:EF-P lysine aminoacylase GenX [Gammaproteobacteria bacterium]NNL06675.1 EF-P lysine aminoacylase GenX [Gammaproteobacteria bacterium]
MHEGWQPAASLQILQTRARMLQDIRVFFAQRGVLEVETPLLSSACTTDPHLHSFVTRYRQQRLYLNTSPEYFMKRLLAAHGQAIYQVCKAFRDDESGPQHNPEFSLLEWYRPGFDMFHLMDELTELVQTLGRGGAIGSAGFRQLSYADAFKQATAINPHGTSADECRQYAVTHNIEQPVGLEDNVDEWLDWLLTQCVIPSFPANSYTYIYDYPRSQAALAKLHKDVDGSNVAARFELFYGATELANGFDELLDADEQRRRFQQETDERQRAGLAPGVIDERLLEALSYGLPACSGVALGLDRLLMLLAGKTKLDHVLAFPFSNI